MLTAVAANDDFRSDLEGLRAVAVVLVLLFHAGVPGLAGGFIGVDVFFVLSGFLITRLLLRELGTTGTVALGSFYARRARRLLPAAALVLFVTVGVSAVVLPPLRAPDVGADASAAALYVANIRFAVQATDYLQSELAPSPLLHYWSLGVEEQFYLCWPALVLLVGRGSGRFARRVGLTALVASLASFAGSIWLTAESAPWAFFSLPTRAWELGIGAILAAAGARLAAMPERLAAISGWLGLGLILVASVAIDHRTPFPGTAALLPALGSALVIASGARASRLGPARLLATPAPRFLGRISYSLYLWHWPILVLPAGAGLSLPFWLRALLLLAAVALAAATQRWVEDPLRRGRFVGVRPARNLAAAALLSLSVAASAASVGRTAIRDLAGASAAHAANPADARDRQAELDAILDAALDPARDRSAPETLDGPVPPGLSPSLVEARDAVPRPYVDGCHLEEPGERSPACVYGDPGAKATVVLFGDCHALNWWDAALHLARERGWRLISLTKAACSAADVRPWYGPLKRVYSECTAWRENSLARIAAERPALVILASSRFRDLVSADGARLVGQDELAAWAPGFIRTVRRIQQVPGVRVVLMGDTPISRFDVPVCLSANQDSVLACATPYVEAVDTGWREALAGAARASGATFVDPEPWVCPSRPCPAVIGDFLVFRDRHHLSPPFSIALARRLAQALPPLAER